jgi:hypothetical protein
MLRNYLICREKREREREISERARGRSSDTITSTTELFLMQNSVTAQDQS